MQIMCKINNVCVEIPFRVEWPITTKEKRIDKIPNVLNKRGKAINFVEKNPLFLKANMSILETIKTLEKFVGENIPILDNNKKLVGIISENDVLKAYSEITKSIRSIEKN